MWIDGNHYKTEVLRDSCTAGYLTKKLSTLHIVCTRLPLFLFYFVRLCQQFWMQFMILFKIQRYLHMPLAFRDNLKLKNAKCTRSFVMSKNHNDF